MQDDSSLRRSDKHKPKPSRELPSSTLWLRDEAASTGERGLSEATNSERGADPPSPNKDVQSADAPTQLLEEAGAPKPGATDPQQVASPQPTLTYEEAEDRPDTTWFANERVGDGVDTDDRREAVQSATSIARDESGFQAWPSTASEAPLNGRNLLTLVLGIAALIGLLFGAWNYTVLESTRAQLSSVTEAKAALDRSLADAQGRLAAAEKAFADVKSALGSPAPAAGTKVTSPKP